MVPCIMLTVVLYPTAFIHCIVFTHFCSVSHSISITEALLTNAIDTVGVNTPKRYRQL